MYKKRSEVGRLKAIRVVEDSPAKRRIKFRPTRFSTTIRIVERFASERSDRYFNFPTVPKTCQQRTRLKTTDDTDSVDRLRVNAPSAICTSQKVVSILNFVLKK